MSENGWGNNKDKNMIALDDGFEGWQRTPTAAEKNLLVKAWQRVHDFGCLAVAVSQPCTREEKNDAPVA